MAAEGSIGVVRDMIDAFNRKSFADFVAGWDPDCEFLSLTGSHIDGEPYRGHEGLRRYADEREEVWSELQIIDVEELREVGDRVLAIATLRARGRGSGVELERRFAIVFALRGGRILSARSYTDPDEAIAAAAAPE